MSPIIQKHKISVSLSQQQCDFLEHYRTEYHYKTRSEVIKRALQLLQQSELEACYKDANAEINNEFEVTAADGTDNPDV